MYLTICDTKQVQSYIFSSNRLAENIGASYLVAQATTSWIVESLPSNNNVKLNGGIITIDDARKIEDGLDAELVYCGGGNAILMFKTKQQSQDFAKKLSIKVSEEAPGLEILIKGIPISFEKDVLSYKLKELFQELEDASHFKSRSSSLPTLSVTAHSNINGSPVVDINPFEKDTEHLVDAETLSKITATKSVDKLSEKWLLQKLPLKSSEYTYPRELDNLGRSSGEFSYIAVIHADGDGIGKRLIKLPERFASASQNRDLIIALRKFSYVLDEAARQALIAATNKLVEFLNQPNDNSAIVLKPERCNATSKLFLPMRPLIVGGDDITVVCDARIAHSFCTTLMRAFAEKTKDLPDGNGGASLSAGIAIVKSHYPFARAYSLSQELLKSAKDKRKQEKQNGAYLDWAFMQSGVLHSLGEIREREYKCDEGYLHSRPVRLGEPSETPNLGTWNYVAQCTREFQSDQWRLKRNKLKALRESLRDGSRAVRDFRSKFLEEQKLPNVDTSSPDLWDKGWYGKSCGYFDALEMIDFYLPFGTGVNNDNTNSSTSN